MRLSTRPDEQDSGRTRTGTWPRTRSERRSCSGGLELRPRARARRVLRAEDRLRRHATASAASGSSAPCSSTTTCRERFDLEYIGADNQPHRPVMIHRAPLGSHGAVHRRPDRAFRRGVPALARAGAGARAAGRGGVWPAVRARSTEELRATGASAPRRPQPRRDARAIGSARRRSRKIPVRAA